MTDIASSNAVIESWANGVEWAFAQERYRNQFGIGGYEYDNNYQLQSIQRFPIYTSIVVDMIDAENQRLTRHRGSLEFPLDRVSGYSILQVEQGLRGATTWNSWRNNMIIRHDNPTENLMNELFRNWHN